tara:strand:- start:549 stop:1406 length:858 start_codon:yes stop_codon:yes gene_type:complete
MRFFLIIIFIFQLYSCEKYFYGSYEIYELNNKKKLQRIYKVKSGDNLYKIANKYKISLKDLIKINNLNTPFKIFPNQKLVIPTINSHIVRKGETIYSISRKYDVDRYQLSKLNNMKSNKLIFPGQKILIPSQKVKKIKKTNNKKTFKQAKSEQKSIKVRELQQKFLWPIKGEVILNFGQIKPGLHNDGINIRGKSGTPVIASETGKVIYVGNEIPGYGNLILIKHKGNLITAYAHLKIITIKKNSKVFKGQRIGEVGKTGNVISPQLHFEIRKGKKAFNPKNFLI